jgi:hypothetical protein
VNAAPDTTAPAASGSFGASDIPLRTGLVGLAAAAAVAGLGAIAHRRARSSSAGGSGD